MLGRFFESKKRENKQTFILKTIHNKYYSRDTKSMYRTIILPVVLYGCETRSLTLWEEHRLRMFENRVLRRIFGPKREKAA
jgi:hypothetical protein